MWDDDERGPTICVSSPTNLVYQPLGKELLKDILLMTRNLYATSDSPSRSSTPEPTLIHPEMYEEYPEPEVPEYYESENDENEELKKALEAQALEEYFEDCYERLCKNKFAYV